MSKLLPRREALVMMGSFVPSLALAQATATPPRDLSPGEQLAAFDAENVDGTRARVDFTGTTVLLFFLSSCSHCHRQIPEWNRALSRRGQGVKVFGVLLDREPPGFFTLNKIDFPVLRAPAGATFRQAYRIRQVPTTLRVVAGGRVDGISVGVTDPIKLGELFRR